MLKTFKTLKYIITGIFYINSSNRKVFSMHDFIIKTLSRKIQKNLFKIQKTQVTFSLTLILKVMILDIPKLSKNVKRCLISQNF